jgi:hypothetical protein
VQSGDCDDKYSVAGKEGILVGLAIEQLDGDFEAAWVALDLEKKMELVLDGLVRGAFKAREESRFDCPEMSRFGLIGDGEYNLINLVSLFRSSQLWLF